MKEKRKNLRKLKFALLILMWAFLPLVTNGTVDEDCLRFRRIGVREGFPQSNVPCIARDNRGFMWIGTENGLNRYNGYDFKIYKHKQNDPKSLADNLIRYIHADRDGVIWLGTESGLEKFEHSSQTFTHYPSSFEKSPYPGFNPVHWIFESASAPGILWVGTRSGLAKFDKKKAIFYLGQDYPGYPEGLKPGPVMSICESSPEILWLGTQNGLYKYDLKEKRLSHYKHDDSHHNSLSHDNVFCVHSSPLQPGILWIATMGGLNRLDIREENFIQYRHDPRDPHSLSNDFIGYIFESPVEKGVLWLGTLGGGLNKFYMQSGKFLHYKNSHDDPYSLSDDFVPAVYQDPAGVLFVGTSFGALNIVEEMNKEFLHFRTGTNSSTGLSHNIILAIFEPPSTPGIFWIGTPAGLNKFDRRTGRFTVYRAIPGKPGGLGSDMIQTIYECPSLPGILWLGTIDRGIIKFNLKNKSFVHYEHDPDKKNTPLRGSVFAFHESPMQPGVLWTAVYCGGLNRLDINSGTFTGYYFNPHEKRSIKRTDIDLTAENNLLTTIYESPADPGTLWLGGYDTGLIKFNIEKGDYSVYLVEERPVRGNLANAVLAIYESPRQPGILWVGTEKGLHKFDCRIAAFSAFNNRESLKEYKIASVFDDSRSNLWLSTDNGLLKFNPRSGVIKKYGIEDGLQGYHFSRGACKGRSGELFFGGSNGFSVFHPSRIKDNPCVPNIVITGFQIFNKPVGIGDPGRDNRPILTKNICDTEEIRLSYKDKVFSFDFAALNYSLPGKNQYAYKMAGFNDEWHYIGKKRSATFTNLSPGSYTFQVKGANNDGLWNERGASIRIIIVPPFYMTWWFKVIMILCLAAAIFALGKKRIKTVSMKLKKEIAFRDLLLKHDISNREKEIIDLILEGKSNKDIEDELYISYHTVKNHLYNIYKKFKVKTRGELILSIKTSTNTLGAGSDFSAKITSRYSSSEKETQPHIGHFMN